MLPDDLTEPLDDHSRAPISGHTALILLTLTDGEATSRRLPADGVLSIGRAETNDVRIDHAMISREHARLHVSSSQISIEDLGSANGTTVGGDKIPAHAIVRVPAGASIGLGASVLVVQRTHRPSRRRRLSPHDYFETRLAEACESSGGEAHAVLRLDARALDGDAVQRVLDAVLRPDDVVAAYAADQLEILAFATDAERATDLADRIERTLGRRPTLAVWPRDGRTADELIAHAGGAAHGDGPLLDGRATRELVTMIKKVAKGTISVLLLGETGVGKEVFAELVHASSPRRERPLVKINCAALSETLLDSELFGHEKGAFSGATAAKTGLLEAASGGTVVLDELGEMPPALQVKLLRAIEQRQIIRVGAVTPRPIDVRFVAATNRDLEQEIAAGRFRADLYFRLNGFALHIPPLRERTDEIPRLAQAFLRDHARALELPEMPALSPRAEAMLLDYGWPGNIRELRNMMERAVLLAPGALIDVEHLPLEKLRAAWPAARASATPTAAAPPASPSSPEVAGLTDAQRAERERIRVALEQHGGSQIKAAKALGISDKTLRVKLDKLGLPRPRKPD